MTRTNALTQATLTLLTAKGFLAWRSNQLPVFDKATGTPRRFAGMRGVPDIVAIAPGGKFWGVEIKTGRDKLSEHQTHFRHECLRRNAVYLVVRIIDDLITAIDIHENYDANA